MSAWAILSGRTVVEIGPVRGALTGRWQGGAGRVVASESIVTLSRNCARHLMRSV